MDYSPSRDVLRRTRVLVPLQHAHRGSSPRRRVVRHIGKARGLHVQQRLQLYTIVRQLCTKPSEAIKRYHAIKGYNIAKQIHKKQARIE